MEKKKLTIKEIGMEKLVIIFLAGIFLIVLSFPGLFSKKDSKGSAVSKPVQSVTTQKAEGANGNTGGDYIAALEKRLKAVLKKVDGIGDVEVMITLKSSKELVTLKDMPYTQETVNETDSSGGNRVSSNVNKAEESVMITEGSGQSAPYVVKELEPEIEGVVVIAQGGGNSNTMVEIIDAVEVLFDVPAHKIKVMKMNSK